MPLPLWARRALAPVFMIIEAGLWLVLAAITVVGLVLAPLDRRRRVMRIGAMGVVYLSVELVALVMLGAVWLMRRLHTDPWWEETNARVLAWALGANFRAGRRCLGFEIELHEPPHTSPLHDPQPLLVLARHGGLGDSFALVWLLVGRYRRQVRVVLKEILQWEPLLDITLNRLGACFLPAQAARGEELAARLAKLARGLGAHDALLLFPEGGNWTPRRRSRAIERLRAARKHRAARAASLMEHVLPPRPGGVLACLDARPGLEVVVFAHTGLDTLTTATAAYRAIPFNRPMTVRWWPTTPAPEGERAQLQWLTTEWAVVDQWIDARKAAPSGQR